ncbi:hypothetical protein HanRHA438_Chr00c07g0846821 [Helianthus annuus]|nr:hypothetical protein HanRHA438_Chr00c07g0846821 [Helianthus annuus]
MIRGFPVMDLTRERFVFQPNDPSLSVKLNVEFRLIKGKLNYLMIVIITLHYIYYYIY